MDLPGWRHDGNAATSAGSVPRRGRRRGPAKLSYLPKEFQHVPGVQKITTPKQLQRLADYMKTPSHLRKPFVRLGCSVRHGKQGSPATTSSTYAVTLDGTVEVLRLDEMDPRSGWKYMQAAGRPWNIAMKFHENLASEQEQEADPESSSCDYYIVRTDETDGSTFLPADFAVEVVCRRDRVGQEDPGFCEYLVKGPRSWWVTPATEVMFSVRTAENEVFSGRDGCFIVSCGKLKSFPQYGFADFTLTARNGQRINIVRDVLEQEAREYVLGKAAPFYSISGNKTCIMRLRASAALRLRKLDLATTTFARLNTVAEEMRQAMAPTNAGAGR